MDYAQDYQNMQNQAQAASSKRDLARIHELAEKQAAEINELAAGLHSLADQVYGHQPTPPATQQSPMPEGALRPVSPLMESIAEAQSSISRSIENIRQACMRFGGL